MVVWDVRMLLVHCGDRCDGRSFGWTTVVVVESERERQETRKTKTRRKARTGQRKSNSSQVSHGLRCVVVVVVEHGLEIISGRVLLFASPAMSATKATGDNPAPPAQQQAHTALDNDIDSLSSSLTDLLSASEESDVTELLKSIDSADGLAKGIESRLDSLLGNLDSLLTALEQRNPPAEEKQRAGKR